MAVNLCVCWGAGEHLFVCVRLRYMHRNSFAQFIRTLQSIGLPFGRLAGGVPVFRVNDSRPSCVHLRIFSRSPTAAAVQFAHFD